MEERAAVIQGELAGRRSVDGRGGGHYTGAKMGWMRYCVVLEEKAEE